MSVSEAIVQLFTTETIAPTAHVFSQTIGNGSATEFTVTHQFNSKKVIVNVYETSGDYEVVLADVEILNVNQIVVRFATPPTANEYTVIVIGG